MKRRSLFLALAAGFVVLGLSARDARAGLIPLPTTLDAFVDSGGSTNGNYTTVSNPAAGELIKFSGFSYTQTTGDPPAASGVHMAALTLPPSPGETGIRFTGAFNAGAGVTSDWTITYQVNELTPGAVINDAYLHVVGGVSGGTGSFNVSETFTSLNGQVDYGTLEAFNGHQTDTVNLPPGVTSFLVEKDISVVGGSNGATLSIIDQGYSSTSVPEPASIALLGIGMTGFLAFRRLFKKASVA
jgi:hypothetical protein